MIPIYNMCVCVLASEFIHIQLYILTSNIFITDFIIMPPTNVMAILILIKQNKSSLADKKSSVIHPFS